MGRRLAPVHAQLLEISRRRDLFYEYQTHAAPQAIDFQENQELVGRIESAWADAGLATFKTYLRDDLARREARGQA